MIVDDVRSWTGTERRALVSVAIQFFVNGAMTASYVARLPAIRDRVGITVSGLGLILTLVALAGLGGSLVAGRVIERIGTRRVLLGGAVVMPVAIPVVGLATAPWVLVAGLLAYATVDVLVDISMNLQGSWLSARRRVPVMHRLHALWSVGAVVGGLAAAQTAAAGVSLPAHLIGVGVATAALLVVVGRGLLRQDDRAHADIADTVDSADGAPADSRAGSPTDRRVRLPMVLLGFGGGLAVIVEIVGSDWAAFRLADDLGATAGLASLAFVAFATGMTIVRFAGDTLQVLVGRHRLHVASLVAAAIGLAVAALVDERWVAIVAYLVAGGGVATFMPKLYDDAARVPGRRGAGLGVMTAGMRVGMLTAPALVGVLAGSRLGVGDAVAIVTLPSIAAFALVTAVTTRTSGTGRDIAATR